MLAWLQRAWVLVLVAGAATAASLLVIADFPWWLALAGAVAALNLHAWLLAIEFALLARVRPGAGLPAPGPRRLLKAWWGEIWTGLQTFCWRQPFRSGRWPDRLPPSMPEGRRALLLVHGFVCNRGLWNPWLERLAATDTAYLAVDLEPVFGSIDHYVDRIDEAVRRLEAIGGGATKPVIVAHSMGGLAVRAWLRARGGADRVHSIVTIGTPHRGTWLARLAFAPNARQMRPRNPWLEALAAAETPQRRALFTCFFSHCDNIVFPASMAMLPGADNRHIEGIAHVDLAFHDLVMREVLSRLERTDA